MTLEKAYEEIIEVLKKHKDICAYDIEDLVLTAKKHLFGTELKEKYGLNLEPRDVYALDWVKFGQYISIAWWGEKHRRTISWSDDGKQPVDELLVVISFPTGAFIFGSDYPKKMFQDFFQELKTYNPKYTDTANNCLYFAIEESSKVFNDFPAILKKYEEKNIVDAKKRKIRALKEQLAELNQ